jgi:hypothetical protein
VRTASFVITCTAHLSTIPIDFRPVITCAGKR